MKINDRGAIKWTSMMLVEHKVLLNKLHEEQMNIKKPILSEDKLEEFDNIINNAFANNKRLIFVLHISKRKYEIEGSIKKIDYSQKSIEISTNNGNINIIVNSLIDIYPL